MLAAPPAIGQVKCRDDNAEHDKQRIVLDPGNPAFDEAAPGLAALGLTNKCIEYAQVIMCIPGEVPGVREQFAFQYCQQHEDRTEREDGIREGDKAKLALKFSGI